MLFRDRLYNDAAHIWDHWCDHPFVDGLGKGDLAPERFRYYMIQDYRYLLEYAKIFALGVVKATDENMMRQFASMVSSFLDGEMKIHKAYMKRLGITDAEVAESRTALPNASYTGYMLACAHNYGLPELLTAILSCAWSYELIADELLRRYPSSVAHPFYGEWVSGYSSEEYRENNHLIFNMVEEVLSAQVTSDAHYKRLSEIFVNCSRYEMGFWDMAWNMTE